MEAIAISLIVGTALVLSGARWGGIARWALGALGLAVLIVSLSRLCELYPNFCSVNCWVGRLTGEPCVAVEPDVPSPTPTLTPPILSPSPSPTISPSISPPIIPPSPPPVSPTISPPIPPSTPTPTFTPVPSPVPTYSPLPPTVPPIVPPTVPPSPRPVQPPPQQGRDPWLEPCTDGNCDCVKYRCLW